MDLETWSAQRADFERLRAMGEAERERWLSEAELRDARATRELRKLLAADVAQGTLLDEDAPSLQQEWSRATAAIGQDVAGYRLIEIVGEGGSATVYRAQGRETVAVKVLKADASSPGWVRRFEQERETLSGLDHPGLIRVLDAGHLDDGRPYLITEFVEGEPIDRFCERHGLDLRARLRLFIGLCRAVHAAHGQLVVHRDLKPSNILVDASGAVKVLDFGVAKLLDPARDPLWTDLYGRGPLTLAYSSPEQVRGERITTACDVYSLGVVLHELIVGSSPYGPALGDRERLERAVVSGTRVDPREAARSGGRALPPGDVVAILERALATDPRDRYSSAEHLAQDIECFLAQRALLSRQEPTWARVRRIARRHPWIVGAVCAIGWIALGSWIGTQRSLRRVIASESIAWRAHANAVQSTRMLADLLEPMAASPAAREELTRLVAESEAQLPDLRDHPETEARLRIALARIDVGLGRSERAEAHLEQALELTRGTPGLSWRDTEDCLRQLVALHASRNDARCVARARELAELLDSRGETEAARRAREDFRSLEARFSGR